MRYARRWIMRWHLYRFRRWRIQYARQTDQAFHDADTKPLTNGD